MTASQATLFDLAEPEPFYGWINVVRGGRRYRHTDQFDKGACALVWSPAKNGWIVYPLKVLIDQAYPREALA